jgi:hypothetical protein
MRYYYETQHLKLDEKISLCRKAKEICDSWFVDVLKASCLRRERVDLNFDDIIKILEKSRLTHFTAIYRNHEQRLEISFRHLAIMTIISFGFIFIQKKQKNCWLD